MKTIDYIVNGTYKSVKVESSVDTYEYINELEKGNSFCIRRVIYG